MKPVHSLNIKFCHAKPHFYLTRYKINIKHINVKTSWQSCISPCYSQLDTLCQLNRLLYFTFDLKTTQCLINRLKKVFFYENGAWSGFYAHIVWVYANNLGW